MAKTYIPQRQGIRVSAPKKRPEEKDVWTRAGEALLLSTVQAIPAAGLQAGMTAYRSSLQQEAAKTAFLRDVQMAEQREQWIGERTKGDPRWVAKLERTAEAQRGQAQVAAGGTEGRGILTQLTQPGMERGPSRPVGTYYSGEPAAPPAAPPAVPIAAAAPALQGQAARRAISASMRPRPQEDVPARGLMGAAAEPTPPLRVRTEQRAMAEEAPAAKPARATTARAFEKANKKARGLYKAGENYKAAIMMERHFNTKNEADRSKAMRLAAIARYMHAKDLLEGIRDSASPLPRDVGVAAENFKLAIKHHNAAGGAMGNLELDVDSQKHLDELVKHHGYTPEATPTPDATVSPSAQRALERQMRRPGDPSEIGGAKLPWVAAQGLISGGYLESPSFPSRSIGAIRGKKRTPVQEPGPLDPISEQDQKKARDSLPAPTSVQTREPLRKSTEKAPAEPAEVAPDVPVLTAIQNRKDALASGKVPAQLALDQYNSQMAASTAKSNLEATEANYGPWLRVRDLAVDLLENRNANAFGSLNKDDRSRLRKGKVPVKWKAWRDQADKLLKEGTSKESLAKGDPIWRLLKEGRAMMNSSVKGRKTPSAGGGASGDDISNGRWVGQRGRVFTDASRTEYQESTARHLSTSAAQGGVVWQDSADLAGAVQDAVFVSDPKDAKILGRAFTKIRMGKLLNQEEKVVVAQYAPNRIVDVDGEATFTKYSADLSKTPRAKEKVAAATEKADVKRDKAAAAEAAKMAKADAAWAKTANARNAQQKADLKKYTKNNTELASLYTKKPWLAFKILQRADEESDEEFDGKTRTFTRGQIGAASKTNKINDARIKVLKAENESLKPRLPSRRLATQKVVSGRLTQEQETQRAIDDLPDDAKPAALANIKKLYDGNPTDENWSDFQTTHDALIGIVQQHVLARNRPPDYETHKANQSKAGP